MSYPHTQSEMQICRQAAAHEGLPIRISREDMLLCDDALPVVAVDVLESCIMTVAKDICVSRRGAAGGHRRVVFANAAAKES